MSVTIDMSEVAKMQVHIDNVLPEALQDALNQAALLTKGEAVRSIQRGPKTGRVYEKKNPTRTHQASAPGQSPATDTGILAGSIEADTKPPATVNRAAMARAVAGSTIEYADFLELGTSSIKKRPFMFPAFLKVKPKLSMLIKHAMKKRLRKNL